MATRDDMTETIDSHVHAVRVAVGASEGTDTWDWWPDDAPEHNADGAASWYYITGYANALDLTAKELISELGL